MKNQAAKTITRADLVPCETSTASNSCAPAMTCKPRTTVVLALSAPPPPSPPCPACGGTPASLIEDRYSTDLTPWWKHYAQKLNPFRLIQRKTEMRWIPMGENDQAIWSHDYIVTRNIAGTIDIRDTRPVVLHDLRYETHWCPLPPLP